MKKSKTLFQKLPFYNTLLKSRRIKWLENIDLLQGLFLLLYLEPGFVSVAYLNGS